VPAVELFVPLVWYPEKWPTAMPELYS